MVDQSKTVTVERDDSIATITINRPRALNALNGAVLQELAVTIERCGADDTRAIVITGTGERAFSAGADLDELAGLDSAAAFDVLSAGQRTMAAIESSPVPVITAVNGLALGGGFELVLASTFPVMADHASLGLPESGLGLIPGFGGTQRLTAAIGKASAAHAMLTGSRLTAQRCFDLGITPVEPVASADLMDTVRAIAQSVAAKGPRAQAAILTAMRTGSPDPQDLALEAALAGIAVGSHEGKEGIAAFKEKRSPSFVSRQGV